MYVIVHNEYSVQHHIKKHDTRVISIKVTSIHIDSINSIILIDNMRFLYSRPKKKAYNK